MANLYSQYASGVQFSAGAIVGSSLGASGLNPIVDRLNSITNDNNLIIGSVISGTNIYLYASGVETTNFETPYISGAQISGTNLQLSVGSYIADNSIISGGNLIVYASGGNVGGASGTSLLVYASGVITDVVESDLVSGTSTNVYAGSINQAGGMLVIENRTSDPANAATGRIWIRTDL